MPAAIGVEQLPPSAIAAWACTAGCTGPLSHIYTSKEWEAEQFKAIESRLRCGCCNGPMERIL